MLLIPTFSKTQLKNRQNSHYQGFSMSYEICLAHLLRYILILKEVFNKCLIKVTVRTVSDLSKAVYDVDVMTA